MVFLSRYAVCFPITLSWKGGLTAGFVCMGKVCIAAWLTLVVHQKNTHIGGASQYELLWGHIITFPSWSDLSFKRSRFLEGLIFALILFHVPAPTPWSLILPWQTVPFLKWQLSGCITGWSWLWVMLYGFKWSYEYQDITCPVV